MGAKIKTSILIDEELWRRFKLKVGAERGMRAMSRAVEEALEDELAETLVLRELERMSAGITIGLDVKPVKPKVETSAGDVVREMRWRRG